MKRERSTYYKIPLKKKTKQNTTTKNRTLVKARGNVLKPHSQARGALGSATEHRLSHQRRRMRNSHKKKQRADKESLVS